MKSLTPISRHKKARGNTLSWVFVETSRPSRMQPSHFHVGSDFPNSLTSCTGTPAGSICLRPFPEFGEIVNINNDTSGRPLKSPARYGPAPSAVHAFFIQPPNGSVRQELFWSPFGEHTEGQRDEVMHPRSKCW